MKYFIAALPLFILLSCKASSQSNSFFPLKKGNIYQYTKSQKQGEKYIQWLSQIDTISRDTIVIGKKYFYFPLFGSWVRYDSIKNNLLTFSPAENCGGYSGERILDSLNVSLNDTLKFCSRESGGKKICVSKDSVVFYGVKYAAITFERQTDFYRVTYIKNIGVHSVSYSNAPGDTVKFVLSSCSIGNLDFGGLQQYPNPFGPSTNISYEVRNYCLVTIRYYDVTGDMVRFKSSEYTAPGKYRFNYAGDLKDLSSGMYTIEIDSEDYIQRLRIAIVK